MGADTKNNIMIIFEPRLRVSIASIPMTRLDMDNIEEEQKRVERYLKGASDDMAAERGLLYEDIKKHGIRNPISLYSLRLPGPHNIDRGFGRIAIAKILGIQDIDVVLVDKPLDEAFK